MSYDENLQTKHELMNRIKTYQTDLQKQSTRIVLLEQTTGERLGETETKINTIDNTVSNLNTVADTVATVTTVVKLPVNATRYEGQLYFVNLIGSGFIHGRIQTKPSPDAMIPICAVPVTFDFNFMAYSTTNKPVAFKIEKGNLYFARRIAEEVPTLTVNIFSIIYRQS